MKRLRVAFYGMAALGGLVLLAALLLLRLLAPQPGEWAVPLRIGPWQTAMGLPSALRLATAPAFTPWLDGRRLPTRWGVVAYEWQAATRSVRLQCAPCRVPVPALGPAPLEVPQLTLTLQRSFEQVQGTLHAGPLLQARFSGQLRPQGLALQLQVLATPIADWYAALAPQLPELAQAHIGGTLALRATVDLPSGRLRVRPQVIGFTVQGLGTDALAHAGTRCGRPSRLRAGDWLARAVLAAEDQRFFEHPGYDLQELQAAWQANQAAPSDGSVRRGASTLSQQLAKLLVTGGERSATRKLRELLYAVEMEQTLGKARILRLYLDNAPWGAGLCGAEAAARDYFQRSARELAPAQAVWLAAMLHNPDAQARRWAHSGGIALPRAEWVARALRAGAVERAALAQGLQALAAPSPRPGAWP